MAFLFTFLLLVANGRAIGSGDTNAVEKTAGALVERGSFVVPLSPGNDPFMRPVPGGGLSIYPPLTALLAAPVFFLFHLAFELNDTGLQVAGKLTAALLSSIAVAVMARSYLRRASAARALVSALLFGLATSVYSTSQALWQHPAVVLFLVAAIDCTARLESAAEENRSRLALAASLCLALAAAARPAAIPMSTVLFLFLLVGHRRQATAIIAAAAIPAALVGAYNGWFFGAPWRFGASASGRFFAALPDSLAGLMVSPARGLLVFTPLALLCLLSLARAARTRSMARGLLAGVFVHVAFIASWNEWHGGESFGPRLLTDMLPALFFYLPEALSAWPAAGAIFGIASLSVQILGGWTYDYRWERLYQRGQSFDSALWSWRNSPIAFAWREGVWIQGVPSFDDGRIRLRLSRTVPFGPRGSMVDASPSALRVSGPPLMRDIRLERGGRVDEGAISLTHPGDALAFRSLSAGERLVRLVGSLDGVLSLETRKGSVSAPLSGPFDLTLPLRLEPGDDVYLRARSGALKLTRLELRAGTESASTPALLRRAHVRDIAPLELGAQDLEVVAFGRGHEFQPPLPSAHHQLIRRGDLAAPLPVDGDVHGGGG